MQNSGKARPKLGRLSTETFVQNVQKRACLGWALQVPEQRFVFCFFFKRAHYTITALQPQRCKTL
jgi:hypothetical protein